MTAPAGPPVSPRSLLQKLLETEPSDVGLAAEAAVALLLAQAALRAVSLQRIVDGCEALRLASRRRDDPAAGSYPERLARAVSAASARLGGACLVRSIALQALLARRGVPATLVIACRATGSPLPGHAWIEVEGTPLGADGRAATAGGDSGFAVLSRLPTGPG